MLFIRQLIYEKLSLCFYDEQNLYLIMGKANDVIKMTESFG